MSKKADRKASAEATPAAPAMGHNPGASVSAGPGRTINPPGETRIAEVALDDVGNIFRLEHINLRIPDQTLGTIFYVMGMGFTRDPHFVVGVDNMWVNVGETQFHLPHHQPQVLRGWIGIVVPSLDGLVAQLSAVEPRLKNTQFAWSRDRKGVSVSCPWGNKFRCMLPSAKYPGMRQGIAHVQLNVPLGKAAGIARFYQQVMDTPVTLSARKGLACASVDIGGNQQLVFQETDAAIPAFDGHHIAVYAGNMSKAFAWLKARGLLLEGLIRHQYRFKDIVDPDTGETVFELEHEVRSFKHPMFLRPLINRDASWSAASFSGEARPVPSLQWGT